MGGTGLEEDKSSSSALGTSAASHTGVGGSGLQLCPAVPLPLPPSLPSHGPHLGAPNLLVKPSWGSALGTACPPSLCWTPRDPHLRVGFLCGHQEPVAAGTWG